MPMIKVYNKGVRPIVWERSLKGTFAIHPFKFDVFSDKKAKEIIEKFEDAVTEADYKSYTEEKAKESEADKKGKK